MSSPDSQRIALFGGTFDPVHAGHLDLVALARRRCGLDRVSFIPCARSPFKAGAPVASSEQRLAMLALAIADRGWEDWADVSRYEIDRPPPSYSWKTAQHFREKQPGSRLCWILGGDQWQQIDQWAEPKKLRASLTFIVVTRRGSTVAPRPGWEAEFLEFEHPASATAIRAGRAAPGWLSPGVERYCREQGLYGLGN
ncbi:MAG: nicotinate (nicotinamide) nucleotide adenylyltransferase [Verrucomicrobiales bacterium]|nr:nicotinate (nicotinamide) nucleotide adenylyltransferase [Verrucomicrobiales bacterium]